MSGLEGRLTIVTGAGSGIGAATARRLTAEGAAVVAADRDLAGAERTAGELGSAAHAVEVDVADEASVTALVAEAERHGPVDGLVNVAGIGATTTAPDTPAEVFDRVMAVNARGTFLCCKGVIPGMVARGSGSIVNVASVAGLVGLRSRAAYCASKGAVISFTRALAVDHVAEGLRVNCVCPGTVDSPWVRRLVEDAGESLEALQARQPMGRLGTPEEVAAAIAFLLGDDAAFATGSALVLDGGLTAA